MSFPLPFTAVKPKIAGGNIRPCRILVLDTTNEDKVVEATGVTVPMVGISVNATKYPPGSVEDSGYLAVSGDAVSYRGPMQEAQVLSGAAISRLDYPLTSDSQGRAISRSIPNPLGASSAFVPTWIVGYPIDTAAAANEIIRCLVVQSVPLYVA